MTVVLDGKKRSAEVRAGLAEVLGTLRAKEGLHPSLHVIVVGDDPASGVYVRNKARRAKAVGVRSEVTRLPEGTTIDELRERIDALNADEDTDGILLQLPVPGIDARPLLDRIDPAKDVDGFHPLNAGLLSQKRPGLIPCTPMGVMNLLDAHSIELKGREALVIGRSDIVGRPMATLLTHRHATVTLAHSRTRDLDAHLGRSDLVVVAMGRRHAIGASSLREGAVVIDVGIHRGEEGGWTGDVAPAGLAERASAYTPVPGGVGPMTIAMLLVNTARAALARRGMDAGRLGELLPSV